MNYGNLTTDNSVIAIVVLSSNLIVLIIV